MSWVDCTKLTATTSTPICNTGRQILAILLGERRRAHRYAGHVDALVGLEHRRRYDLGHNDFVRPGLAHFELDAAIVDEQIDRPPRPT